MTVVQVLRVRLELLAPGGVTAPEATAGASVVDASLPLATDAQGAPYVPGTSVAGSLRATASDEETANFLLGYVRPDLRPKKTEAHASRVTVLGTRVDLPDGATVSIRQRTAIDRERAAAASSMLQSRELLPPGTTVDVWLQCDVAHGEQLLDLVRRWRPWIGGGRTAGYGRAAVTGAYLDTFDLATADGLAAWLTTSGPRSLMGGAPVLASPAAHADEAATDEPSNSDNDGDGLVLLFGRVLRFQIVDALHIGTGRDLQTGSGTDSRSVAELLTDHAGVPIVPGTTWKGVLRSRAEYILRSTGLRACVSVGEGTCGRCVVCSGFGSAKSKDPESVNRRGVVYFSDSPVIDGMPRTRNHVALDRVFGGASDKLLFTEQTIEGGTTEIAIRHQGAVDETLRAALLLALQDLADGLVGIGKGTTRGYGTLAPVELALWSSDELAQARSTLSTAVRTNA